MSKTFRPWLVDQPQRLPPAVMEFVPEGHVAHFVRNRVHDELELPPTLRPAARSGAIRPIIR
jgi:hypothetical protein